MSYEGCATCLPEKQQISICIVFGMTRSGLEPTIYRKLNGCPLNDMNVCLFRVSAATYNANRIGGVMVRVLASIAVDRGFEPRSGHTKDYTN
jgi:hypothetical protein